MSISEQHVEVQFPKTSSIQRKGNEDGDEESSSPSPPIKEGMQEARRKAKVVYRECQKNHAASIGGNARDGCGEFMASGEEGTLEALKCSACGCHRNFHRKETEDEFSYACCHSKPHKNMKVNSMEYPTGAMVVSSRMTVPQRMRMGAVPSESEEQEGIRGAGAHVGDKQKVKKRFRTKFTQEQKEKMSRFAERACWRIQKQEESVVQQFCQEIGIKRRALKVWMHNNKHNFARNKLSPH